MRAKIIFFGIILGIVILSGCTTKREVVKLYECPNGQLVEDVNNCPKKTTSILVTSTINQTTLFLSTTSTTITTTIRVLNCCYPSDCPESINNPIDCSCTYLIQCNTKIKNLEFDEIVKYEGYEIVYINLSYIGDNIRLADLSIRQSDKSWKNIRLRADTNIIINNLKIIPTNISEWNKQNIFVELSII